MQNIRDAKKYRITLEEVDGKSVTIRKDGKAINRFTVDVSFHSDYYGTSEYLRGLRDALRRLEDHEIYEHINLEKAK